MLSIEVGLDSTYDINIWKSHVYSGTDRLLQELNLAILCVHTHIPHTHTPHTHTHTHTYTYTHVHTHMYTYSTHVYTQHTCAHTVQKLAIAI